MDFSRLEGLRDELCATLLFDLGLRRAHARNLLGFSGGSLSGTGLGGFDYAAISARHIGNDCGRVRGFRRCFIAVLAKERARMTDEVECLIGIVLLFVMYVAWIFESDDRDE